MNDISLVTKRKCEFMLFISKLDNPKTDELDLSLLHIDDPTPINPSNLWIQHWPKLAYTH